MFKFFLYLFYFLYIVNISKVGTMYFSLQIPMLLNTSVSMQQHLINVPGRNMLIILRKLEHKRNPFLFYNC